MNYDKQRKVDLSTESETAEGLEVVTYCLNPASL